MHVLLLVSYRNFLQLCILLFALINVNTVLHGFALAKKKVVLFFLCCIGSVDCFKCFKYIDTSFLVHLLSTKLIYIWLRKIIERVDNIFNITGLTN